MSSVNRIGWTAVAVVCGALIFSAPGVAREKNDGFIYGKITMKNGNTYTGIMRWGTEETFWDDHFNGNKDEQPYYKYIEKFGNKGYINTRMRDADRQIEKAKRALDEAKRKNDDQMRKLAEEMRLMAEQLRVETERNADRMEDREHDISVLGGAIKVRWNDWGTTHIMVARFGDIRKIKVVDTEDAELTMKDGSVIVASGGSNDMGEGLEINVRDNSLGDVNVTWRKIDTIEFMDTPASVTPWGQRAYGTVESDAGTFQGYIQWDSEECCGADKIDGFSDDGKMSIPLGQIKSISRAGKRSSDFVLKDGRKLNLHGTNDVDESIRGVLVEDPRYGRVKIPWDAFEKATFSEIGDNGPGYNEFAIPRTLKGSVEGDAGTTHKGRLVYDIDEAYTWEMVNGNNFDVEYSIPFDKIKSIHPASSSSSEIELRSGGKVRLEGTQDVSNSNDGVLIFKEGDAEPDYLNWDSITKINFE